MKVAFAGLGVMGFPMAGHLARAGHDMAVYNRGPEKAARWVAAHGGRAGGTAAEAAAGAIVFVLCVGDAPVSGGQAGAENGQLTIMCGGEPAAFAKAEPVIAAYAKATRLMGGPG